MNVEIVKAAAKWRRDNPKYQGGVVLFWDGKPTGWRNKLRDARTERPGVVGVDDKGRAYVATGGDDQSGAKAWVVCND